MMTDKSVRTPEERATELVEAWSNADDGYGKLETMIAALIREENKACERICEELDPEKPSRWLHRRENLAAAIRARMETKP
jgi:hypothetical protein